MKFLQKVHSDKKNTILILLLVVFASISAKANVEKAYDYILDFRFEEAEKTVETIEEKNQSPDFWVVCSFAKMLRVVLSEDEGLYENYLSEEDFFIERLERFADKKNFYYPEYKWAKAEILLHSAALRLSFDDKWSAAWRIRQAYKLLLENDKTYPSLPKQKKSLGLLQVAIGSVPQKYQWMLSVVGMEASLQEGIQNLNLSTQNKHFFQTEAFIWQALLGTYLLDEQKESEAIVRKVIRKNPHKKLLLLVHSLVMMKDEKHQEALSEWKKYFIEKSLSAKNERIHSLKYLWAELYFYTQDYTQAEKLYRLFLSKIISERRNFVKDTYYKLFLIDWLDKNDTRQKEDYFKKILQKGKNQTAADKRATRFAEAKSLPIKEVHFARILTDGGNYQAAWQLIQRLDNESLKKKPIATKLEFWYRKARILHKMNRSLEAILFYKKVVQNGSHKPYYFAPFSALQLGYLLEKNEPQESRKYYQMALDAKNHPYEESVSQKAKIALKRLSRELRD